ncbi:hypothetical protein M422DRAFT_775309 [Sphaerobolus stellatus SS14]|nr:hypothetical protein M422DRAFT_775309 [Sphaerobolus stellatus SS14]
MSVSQIRICQAQLSNNGCALWSRAAGQYVAHARCRNIAPPCKDIHRVFSSAAPRLYPRYDRSKEGLQKMKADWEVKSKEPEPTPHELAQGLLERSAQSIMLDDGRLLHAINEEKATYRDYLRICLSRLHPIILYQYFHEDPLQFAIGYRHRKTAEGRAREATLYLFTSANGWFWRAMKAADRDGVQFDEDMINAMSAFEGLAKQIEEFTTDQSPANRDWVHVALPLVECATDAPKLWKEEEWGGFEPLPIIPMEQLGEMDDASFETQLNQIYNEVKSGTSKKPRRQKVKKSKADLGFAGDDDADLKPDPVKKKPNAGEQFFNYFRTFLQQNMRR